MQHIPFVPAVALAALILSGCGGGGSGGPAPHVGLQHPSSLAASVDQGSDEIRKAASSLPAFGSVTQSSNEGIAGITTDAARATFNGTNATVTITRQDGSTVRLNTATDALATVDLVALIPGHTGKAWGTFDYTDTSLTFGTVAVIWDRSDSTDFLAGGYWMHVTGNVNSDEDITVTGGEAGAYVDGPELSGGATIPSLGTATYNGTSFGIMGETDSAGNAVIADYQALANLTADFGNGTISGCIGCTGGIEVEGIIVDADGEVYDYADTLDASVRLGSAPITSDGNFRASNVSAQSAGVASSSGSWGGQFSNIQHSSGDPRLVAGTVGVEWRGTDGSEGEAVGFFGGVR